jgi:TRAP-type C4-dicarboxylate transport system permease small subunit
MDKTLKIIDNTLGWVMVVLMAVLVIDVVWQVTTRYVLGSASSYTEEIARFLLIWIGLLGSAFAYRKNLHLAFDYFSDKVTGRRKKWLGYFIHSLVAIFSFLVLVVGGGYLVQLTWELNQVSAALQIKLAYVYSVLPLSGALIILYAISFISDIARDRVQTAVPESKSAGAA